MGYNDRYWGNRPQRALEAQRHTVLMANEFSKDILNSIKGTIEYTNSVNCNKVKEEKFPRNTVIDLDSVGAIFKYKAGKTCVLNFASYRNPGGKFIDGSKAQEECLCHASFLYNVLKEFPAYYEYNEKTRNKGLYKNRALYTPNVLFVNENNEKVFCDVLTCAAPNKSALMHYADMDVKEKESLNANALLSRIQFIKDIVEENEVDTFIAGAYGCGVFRQDAMKVAMLFKEIFDKTTVQDMIYAIPIGMDKDNYMAFKSVFGN